MSSNSDADRFIEHIKAEGFELSYQTCFLIRRAYEEGYDTGVEYTLDLVKQSSEYAFNLDDGELGDV